MVRAPSRGVGIGIKKTLLKKKTRGVKRALYDNGLIVKLMQTNISFINDREEGIGRFKDSKISYPQYLIDLLLNFGYFY